MAAPNPTLTALLEEAGLSPRALAREINRLFGPGAVSDTAPYHWRDHGGVPHAPLPSLTAHVLSRRLGRVIDVDSLWHGAAPNSTAIVPATSGMDLPWNVDSTVRVTRDWLMTGLVDRRIFLAVSGTALARAVCVYLNGGIPLGRPAINRQDSDSPLISQIEQSIPLLQQLDDAMGGAANLGYVGAQVRAVSLVLAEGGHNATTERRLMVALAEISQLAGWMAHDAEQDGLAQRYLFTALRAAYDCGDGTMAGHVLADLSVQATALGQPGDAVMLGEAGTRAAARSTPSVRASIVSRLAHAYAGAGRANDFDRARGQALDLLDRREAERDPAWMYYLTPSHLDCQAGYSLIMMGRREREDAHVRRGNGLVRDGQRLLRTGAYDWQLSHPSQRRALYEGSWLALGCATRGHLDEACEVGRTALARLDRVRSPRSVRVLRALGADLNRRRRNQAVADFVPELRGALARQAA